MGKVRMATLAIVAVMVICAYWVHVGAKLALDHDLRSRTVTHFEGTAGSCAENPLGVGGRVALKEFPYKCGWNYVSSSEDGNTEVFAFTMPSGKLGWSNTALVVDHRSKQSVLFDVTMDASTTRTMLQEVSNITEEAPIRSVIFTHGDPDHTFGSCELPEDADLYATKVTTDEIKEANSTNMNAVTSRLAFASALSFGMLESIKQIPGVGASILYPQMMRALDLVPIQGTRLGRLLRFGYHYFIPFRPHTVSYIRVPNQLLDKEEASFLDGKIQIVAHCGHSGSDLVALIPSTGVAIAGDILFMGLYPLSKFGPAADVLKAIDYMVHDNKIKYFIPGHGPIMDRQGVQQVRNILTALQQSAVECKSKNLSRKECIQRFQTFASSEFALDSPEHLEISMNVELDRLEGRTPNKRYFMDTFGKSLVKWGLNNFQ
eukprot:CAMPEP_0198724930 /NCGR_PEP_ID=MMETSP1475-20131203/2319_1 /TAXON_ID= ORGANISM="Unidentified sp., Strain CCMP1999" /NCGR_SAMPLE_ID=MMETSP1475 /ASSEMBLY_ACC=CAM_ASM_001111 /LENGTH=431 /DNA_ID=CAMNT_0044486575 /DNA_START=82 /DNA_END=1377 /DNA_ORIENTATION=-